MVMPMRQPGMHIVKLSYIAKKFHICNIANMTGEPNLR